MTNLRDVRAGDELPTISRPGRFDVWSRYAAVNYEIADHHMDDEVARHEGFPGAFAMAPLTFAYVQTMLRDWLDDQGAIASVSVRLHSPFLRGRTLTIGGTVRERRADGGVEVDVWARDDLGTRILSGSATVSLAADSA